MGWHREPKNVYGAPTALLTKSITNSRMQVVRTQLRAVHTKEGRPFRQLYTLQFFVHVPPTQIFYMSLGNDRMGTGWGNKARGELREFCPSRFYVDGGRCTSQLAACFLAKFLTGRSAGMILIDPRRDLGPEGGIRSSRYRPK